LLSVEKTQIEDMELNQRMTISWRLSPRAFIRLVLAFGFSGGFLMAGSLSYSYSGSLQNYFVAEAGTYQIEVTGAGGGTALFRLGTDAKGGVGAQVIGTYTLTEGDVLNVLVGGAGYNGTDKFDTYGAGGGGGASLVMDQTTGQYLAIAGGGGGGGAQSANNGANGGLNASAGFGGGYLSGGAAGTNGGGGQGGNTANGGSASVGAGGGGGGGLQSAGTDGSPNDQGSGGNLLTGQADSGSEGGAGGFGGGGGGGGGYNGGGGGGGGYNGGGGGMYGYGGGGGGSFSIDPNAQFGTASAGGNGSVTITELISTTPVPEPGEVGMLTLAAGALALLLRRKQTSGGKATDGVVSPVT
jgi:hypothetical protein